MNLVQCKNGHFYDESRYDSCPHCAGDIPGDSNVTMPLQNAGNSDVTVPLTSASSSDVTSPLTASLQNAINSATGIAGADEKTVSFYKRALGSEPVTGWLVCIEGEHFGEDFRLKSGRNFIGRGADMDVVIAKDNAVSRDKHAIVVYEPKGNQFIIMPGESKELCYLNDEVVLSTGAIKANDVLTVGDTKLMFIPCCGPAFNWDAMKK